MYPPAALRHTLGFQCHMACVVEHGNPWTAALLTHLQLWVTYNRWITVQDALYGVRRKKRDQAEIRGGVSMSVCVCEREKAPERPGGVFAFTAFF